MSWRGEYSLYMQSPHWKGVRSRMIARSGNRCQKCGSEGPLEVHHLHYRNLGHELVTDLEVLCRHCHVSADEQRSADNFRDGQHNGYRTWLRRSDGDDTPEEWDRFNDWRASRHG